MDATAQVFSVVISLLLVLGALAALSAYLGVGTAGEAFGLPSGTIRAVLALGLLIAFVVFGIGQLDRLGKGKLQPDVINVRWTELDPESAALAKPPRADRIQVYRQSLDSQGLLVRSIDQSQDPVRFNVLIQPHPDFATFSRDIMSVLGTLLASILSFYFGSRAVETGAKAMRGSDEGTPDRAVSSAAPPSLTANNISFEAPNSIRHAGRGLGIFRPGDSLRVIGGPNDARVFTVEMVGAGQLTTAEAVVQSTDGGAYVTLAKLS